MHTEKRECGVGDRINEIFYLALCLCSQIVIIAAEGDDSHFDFHAVEAGDSVALEAGTVDDELARNGFLICKYLRAGIFFLKAGDIAGEKYLIVRVLFLYEFGKLVHYGDKIDYACAGDFYSGDTCAIRLDLFNLGGSDFFDTFDTILDAVIEDTFETGEFFFACGDDDFATDFVGDAVLSGEGDELFASVGAGSGLG